MPDSMESTQNALNEIAVDRIVDDIHDNKCILFLGPLIAAVEYKGKLSLLSDVYCEQLLEELKPVNITFDQDVKRNPYFLYAKYGVHFGGRANLERKLKSYFNAHINSSASIYESLSKLPFNTIINFGFDRMMQNALNKNGYDFSDKYYNYRDSTHKPYLEGLDDNFQLVYNLFGSVTDINSQILTEEDQLLFMRNIVSDRKLPDNVLSRVQDPDSKSYVFLGFNFEEWPFRFLMDVLRLPRTTSSAAPKSLNSHIAFMTKEFYQEKFGLKFIDLDPESFVRSLVKVYSQKYRVDRHRKGFIACDIHDEAVYKELRIQLKNQRLGKRIQFWGKDQLIPGDNEGNIVNAQLTESTVYVPLISSRFLNDDRLLEQLRIMLTREDTLVFPILVSNCDFESYLIDIPNRPSLILPGGDKVLLNTTGPPSASDYVTIIKKINSKVR